MVQRITISPNQYHDGSSQSYADALPAASPDAWILLTAEQVHYLTRVLRLRAGETFIAQNGKGQQWRVAIGKQPEKAPVIEAVSVSPETLAAPLRLIAALPKGNSFDQVVRQATELGVTHICPVISQRTLLKPSDNKLTRWRRIAEEASEQCERITVPVVFEPVSFEKCIKHPPWEGALAEAAKYRFPKEDSDYIAEYPTIELRPELHYLCAARSVADADVFLLADLLAHQPAKFSSGKIPGVTLAIGPEGGWTSEEIAVAIENSYKVASLGSAILRAVTAPLTALSLVAAARNLLI